MKLIIYQVDAFANKVFEGNPAAVIPMQEWMDDELMQQIAMENNLAETAFFVPKGDDFTIRWFTPEMEINLCGHATLASAYIIFNRMGFTKSTSLPGAVTIIIPSTFFMIAKSGRSFTNSSSCINSTI